MTFAFTAMAQIVNQMVNIHYISADRRLSLWCFAPQQGSALGGGATLSEPHPMFMNLAGLKLVMPSNPYDDKGLTKSAIRDNNPAVFFED